jgi:hypothetical protein
MNLEALRKLIREEMRTVIREELKGILTEAVIIASTPETKTQAQTHPHVKVESTYKPKFSEILAEKKTPVSTGNPMFDLLNETANEGGWRSINGGYNASDAVGWAGGMPGMGGANTPVVASVDQMVSQHAPVHDINDVRIDAVPDFTGLMGKLKENGKL